MQLVLLKSKQQMIGLSVKYIHLLSGEQEANNSIGQLRSLGESDTARSGQSVFLVSALVFTSVPTLLLYILLLLVLL